MIDKISPKNNIALICRKLLTAAGIAAFVHILFFNLRYLFDRGLKMGYIFHNSSWLMMAAGFVFLSSVGFLIVGFLSQSKKVSTKIFIIFLLVTAAGLRTTFLLLFNSTPISDFQLLYRAAEELVKGNYDFIKKSEYFLAWVYQIGFVTYQALVIKIFGQGYLALKLLNVVFSTGTCLLIYLSSRKLFGEAAGRAAGLVYCFYPSSIYMCTVLTNQILSTFLFYLAMYLAIGRLKKYSFLLLGLFAALGNIIRPEGPIILAAISVYILVFKRFDNADGLQVKNRPKACLKSFLHRGSLIAGIVSVFFIVTQLYNLFITSSNISDYPLSNRNPLWKFVVGLNYNERGLYNKTDDSYVSKYPLGEERNRVEKELIKERLEDKVKLLKLMQIKARIFWSDYDHALTCYVAPGTDLTPFKTNLLVYLEKAYYTILSLFLLAGFGFIFMKKQVRIDYLLYLIFILGFMFVHLFIEIQLRYRYVALPAFFILAGVGITRAAEWLGKLSGDK